MSDDYLETERVLKIRDRVDDSLHLVNLLATTSDGGVPVLLGAMANVLKTIDCMENDKAMTREALTGLHHQLAETIQDAGESVNEKAVIAFTKLFATVIYNLHGRLQTAASDEPITAEVAATSRLTAKREAAEPAQLQAVQELPTESEEQENADVPPDDEDSSSSAPVPSRSTAPFRLLDQNVEPPGIASAANTGSGEQNGSLQPADQAESEEQSRPTKEPSCDPNGMESARPPASPSSDNEEDGENRLPQDDSTSDGRPSASARSSKRSGPKRNRATASVSSTGARRKSSKSGRVKCNECQQEISNSDREGHVYRKHLNSYKMFSCPLCDYSTYSPREAHRHIERVHKKDPRKTQPISHEWKYATEIASMSSRCFVDWLPSPAVLSRRQSVAVKQEIVERTEAPESQSGSRSATEAADSDRSQVIATSTPRGAKKRRSIRDWARIPSKKRRIANKDGKDVD